MLATDLALALDPALVLTAQGLTPDPWQAAVLRSTAKQTLLLCTRQAGKSTTTAALAAHTAVYQPGALVVIGAPSLRQSQELFRKVKTALQALPAAPRLLVDNTTALELSTGSRIEALPENEETTRGLSGVALLLLDEAARIEDRYYYAQRPTLGVSGGRIVALSTPFGQIGWFYEAWMHGGSSWQRTKITAYDCPRISTAFLEEERRSMDASWFEQEYLCEFRARQGGVFAYDDIRAMLSPSVAPLFPVLEAV